MLASQLVEILNFKIKKYGDLPIVMLEEDTGEYEGVHCVFFVDIEMSSRGRKEFELATYRQAEFSIE